MRLEIHISHPDHAMEVSNHFPYPYVRLSTNEAKNGIAAYEVGRKLTTKQEKQLHQWKDEKVISGYEMTEPEIRILAQDSEKRTVQLSANYYTLSLYSQVVAALYRDGTVGISTLSNSYDTSETYRVNKHVLSADEMSVLVRAYTEYLQEVDAESETDETLDLDAHPF